MIDTVFKIISGIVRLRGGTDGSVIGNSGDALKTAITSFPAATIQAWSKKLRYDDMSLVARATAITTSWTDVYSYTGSGYLAGFVLNLEAFTLWKVRLVVDGDEIFGSSGITTDDLTGDSIYDADDVTDANQAYLGLSKGSHDRFVFHAPIAQPIYYASSVVIKLARVSGASKKFQAGLTVLSKET